MRKQVLNILLESLGMVRRRRGVREVAKVFLGPLPEGPGSPPEDELGRVADSQHPRSLEPPAMEIRL